MRPVPVDAPAAAEGLGARSTWHSPVPYLFGGLAAMLGLIAFALLLLACSYWKLSGFLDSGEETRDGAAAADDAKPGFSASAASEYEERIVVIMAGDDKPTFLAMPISTKSAAIGEKARNDENGGEERSDDGGAHNSKEEECTVSAQASEPTRAGNQSQQE